FSTGAGSTALYTNAKSLYLYQLVNNGPTTQFVSSIGLTVRNATSWGYFGGLGLFDDQGAMTAANTMGEDGTIFVINAAVSAGGTATAGVTAIPDGKAPLNVFVEQDTGGQGNDSFRAEWSKNNAVKFNQRSVIFGYTSDAPPDLAQFSAQAALAANAQTFGSGVRQGGDSGGGNQTPEPSTLVLSCLGLLGLSGARAWRNRGTKPLRPALA